MSNNDLSARFLRTPEAARLLGLSPRTLEKHRTYGTGPTYRKLGGRIVYAPEDLKLWADRGVRQSTSDPGRGTVKPAKPPAGHVPRPRTRPQSA
jgi:predicted DNA-binding transcriptional regulator AlpA